jgi:hypothetical protein
MPLTIILDVILNSIFKFYIDIVKILNFVVLNIILLWLPSIEPNKFDKKDDTKTEKIDRIASFV